MKARASRSGHSATRAGMKGGASAGMTAGTGHASNAREHEWRERHERSYEWR